VDRVEDVLLHVGGGPLHRGRQWLQIVEALELHDLFEGFDGAVDFVEDLEEFVEVGEGGGFVDGDGDGGVVDLPEVDSRVLENGEHFVGVFLEASQVDGDRVEDHVVVGHQLVLEVLQRVLEHLRHASDPGRDLLQSLRPVVDSVEY